MRDVLGVGAPAGLTLHIVFVKSPQTYAHLIGQPALALSAGAYSTAQQTIYVRVQAQEEASFAVLRHEITHALVHESIGNLPTPLNEGMAEYFGRYRVSGLGGEVDIGAGRGIASYALAKEGFEVTALEPDASDLVGAGAIRELSNEAHLSISIAEEFSEKLPFPDHAFDVVFARAVLHHTSDLSAACREFFRVLKPGGRFIAVREHVISSERDLPIFLDRHPLHKLYGGENAFLLNDYRNSIVSAGFKMDRLLTPFESEINFAPYTPEELKTEIGARIGMRLPLVAKATQVLLDIRAVWAIFSRAAANFDHRPGRLYSFVATRPL
jgi:SAM-dependent methyltransferase